MYIILLYKNIAFKFSEQTLFKVIHTFNLPHSQFLKAHAVYRNTDLCADETIKITLFTIIFDDFTCGVKACNQVNYVMYATNRSE